MTKLNISDLKPQQLALLLRYEAAQGTLNVDRANLLHMAANILDAMPPDERGLIHPKEMFATRSGVNETLLAYLRQDPVNGYSRAVQYHLEYMGVLVTHPQASFSFVQALAAHHDIAIRKG